MSNAEQPVPATPDPFLDALFASHPGFVVRLDPQLRILQAGSMFATCTGKGAGSSFLDTVNAFERTTVETAMSGMAAAEGASPVSLRIHHPGADGATTAVEYDWMVCRNGSGAPVGFLGIGRERPADAADPHEVLKLREELNTLRHERERHQREIGRLRKDLASQSQRDDLTGLGNRRYILDRLESEVARAVRYDEPMTVLLFDIDHLDRVNETYGQETGDLVLRQVAETVREQVRNTDFASRYDGEAFLVLCPHTDRASAQFLAERLRRRIAELSFEAGGEEFGVTVSSGLVTVRGGTEFDVEAVLRAARQALDGAKNGGRNRVQLVESP